MPLDNAKMLKFAPLIQTRVLKTMTCDNDHDRLIIKEITLQFVKAVIVMVNGHSQKVSQSRSQ